MKVNINTRSGKQLHTFELQPSTTVEELKDQFNEKFHYYPERQWFNIGTAKGPSLKDGTLESNEVRDGTNLVFKDLGVQISWRLVFAIEYFGPLLFFPFFYFCPTTVYGTHSNLVNRSLTQKVAFWLAIIHYVKREMETLFVHRFSNATMPIIRLPINCFHYWILCGVAVGYYVCHPSFYPPFSSPALIYLLAGLMLAFEFLNYQTHIVLRQMRPRNTKTRGIPYGWGFDVVSCANYLWEISAWLSFAVLVNCFTGWIFFFVATGQMIQWALKRHRAYIKEFPNYPRDRAAIFPFIL